jgi:hypothetical protein
MALQNLQEDAKAIVLAIKRGASSSDDPVRDLLNRIPADFEMEQETMVKEIMLQQKKIPGKGKGYEGEGSEIFGDRKEEVEDFCSAWLNDFSARTKKKGANPRGKVVWVTEATKSKKGKSFYGTAFFKEGVQDAVIFNWFQTLQTETKKALQADPKGKYDNILRDASKGQTGKESPFNIGHNVSVSESRLSIFAKSAVEAAQESGAFATDQEAKDFVMTSVNNALGKNELDIEIDEDIEISFNKDKGLTGSVKVTYAAEGWFKNQVLRQEEANYGSILANPKNKNSLLESLQRDIEEESKRRLVGQTNKQFEDRKGSNSLTDNALAIIINNPTMRRLYKKKLAVNLSKIKFDAKGKNQTAKAPLNLGGPKKRKKIVGSRGIALPKQKDKQENLGKVESGNNELMRKAFETRAFVNSRLEKTVAGNMGRPGLENRTGRFARSAQVTNAMAVGNQVHMDYTYNPLYRVFEDGGQFTANYDPRPLIESSIRELAAAKLETKFTLRRV